MGTQFVRHAGTLMIGLGALGLLLQTGCGGLKRVPASGTVTLDGKPIEGGILYFNADVSKGNTAQVSCTSPIRDGRFELQTAGIKRSDSGPGIPLGWYKVSLRVNMPGDKPIFPGPAVVNINSRYLDPEKTPLSIEVVENPEPGAYDLKLTK